MNTAQPSAPHFQQPLLKTPFHERARALSQVDSFIAWAGYTTVDVFTTAEQEYFAIRNATTLYDLTPMVKYRVAGPDAMAYLNRLVTRNLAKLKADRVGYCVWCNDAGHILDDGTVFRLGDDEYRLCTAERQLDWLLDSAIGFDVEISEVTEQIAALAMQGPTSCAVLKAARPRRRRAAEALRDRIFFAGRDAAHGVPHRLYRRPGLRAVDGARSGGASLGCIDGRRALARHSRHRLAGAQHGAHRGGILESACRFRVGGADDSPGRDRSPLELGLAWLIDFDKGHFTGRRALLAERSRGPRRQLVGLDVVGNKPAHNALLYAAANGKREIGSVSSATWSPTCKRNIALAMVDAPYFRTGTTVWADIYLNRELVWERRMSRAQVVERPFFAPDRRRATPPAEY